MLITKISGFTPTRQAKQVQNFGRSSVSDHLLVDSYIKESNKKFDEYKYSHSFHKKELMETTEDTIKTLSKIKDTLKKNNYDTDINYVLDYIAVNRK